METKCLYTRLAGVLKKICKYIYICRFITAVCHKFTDQRCSSAGCALYCSATFSRFESRQKVGHEIKLQLNSLSCWCLVMVPRPLSMDNCAIMACLDLVLVY